MAIDAKELKQPDEFVTVTRGFFEAFIQKKQVWGSGLALFVVMTVGGIFYFNRQTELREKAQDAYFQALLKLDQERKPLIEAEQKKLPKPAITQDAKAPPAPDAISPEETVKYKKLDVQKTYVQGVPALLSVAESFKGTRSAFHAYQKLAQLYYDHGQPEQAVPFYEKAIDSAPTEFERAMMMTALAATHEDLKQHPQAINWLEKASRVDDKNLPRADIFMAIARNQESLKDVNGARSTYDRIMMELPHAPQAQTAQILKARLK